MDDGLPAQEVRQPVSINPRAILILAVLATTLASLEVGLVSIALPTLAATFSVTPATIQWVAIVYQLAIIGTLVPFGRLVDLLGGRPIYLAGMAMITAGSVAASLSPGIIWLILARGFLGLGAAMLLTTSQALVTEAYPNAGRGRALGVIHMAVAGGLMAGPSVGGLLITLTGWRSMFAFPILIATLALWLGWRSLPRQAQRTRESIDVLGSVLMFTVAVFAVFGVNGLTEHGGNRFSLLMLMVAILLGILFVIVERHRDAPIVDLSLLHRWEISAGLLAAFLTFIALASNMFLMPFALQDMMGHSAAQAGLIMMTVPLVILPVAPLAGMLADRLGSRWPTTTGLAVISLAILGMAQFDSTTSVGVAIAVLGVYGLGAGLFQAPNNSAVLGAAPQAREGVTSGMLALSRNLGQVAGITAASSIWTWRQSVYAAREPNNGSSVVLVAALHDAFLALAGFALLALVVSAVRS